MNPCWRQEVSRLTPERPDNRLPYLQAEARGFCGVLWAQPDFAVHLDYSALATYEALLIALHLPPVYAIHPQE